MSLKFNPTPEQVTEYGKFMSEVDMTGYYKPSESASNSGGFNPVEPCYSKAISMEEETQQALNIAIKSIQEGSMAKIPAELIGSGNPVFSQEVLNLIEKAGLEAQQIIEVESVYGGDLHHFWYILFPNALTEIKEIETY